MALTKCKACGEEISKNAKSCPKCGEPQGSKRYSLGSLLVLIIFIFMILSFFQDDEPKKKASSKPVVVSQEQTEKLERCANELLEKNQNMMSPPVGVWGTLRDIDVVIEGSKIKVIYYANHLFTNERRKGLDMSQKAFTRDTECSPSVITTWAE